MMSLHRLTDTNIAVPRACLRKLTRGLSVILLASIVLTACTTVTPRLSTTEVSRELLSVPTPLPSNISALRTAFRKTYDEAVIAHTQKLRSSNPIITQDLLNMTLLRANGPPLRFSMKSGAYFLMAHSTHPPLTVYAILSKHGFGTLSDSARTQLADYSVTLTDAVSGVKEINLPLNVQDRLIYVIDATNQFISKSLQTGNVTRDDFQTYVAPLRKAMNENLNTGAYEQLRQFKDKLEAWQAEFPDENWSGLRVVVLGLHQARDQYALKAFFQWLLREPTYESRVVYAEFQSAPVGDDRIPSEARALELLTKVDLEQDAAELIFGDRAILQRDVMGPAALQILRDWGMPNWP